MAEIRDKSLSYMYESMVQIMKDTLPYYLSDDNTKANLAPAAALSLIETCSYYCVITMTNENQIDETTDRTIPAVSRDFVIYIGAHQNEDLIKMYDEILKADENKGIYNICAKASDFFQNLSVKLGSNPFIFYDSGLCELVLNVSVIN